MLLHNHNPGSPAFEGDAHRGAFPASSAESPALPGSLCRPLNRASLQATEVARAPCGICPHPWEEARENLLCCLSQLPLLSLGLSFPI